MKFLIVSFRKAIFFLAPAWSLMLMACSGASSVLYDMQYDVKGEFVIKENSDSLVEWRRHGSVLELTIKGPVTEIKSFDLVNGRYIKYMVRMNTGELLPLTPIFMAKPHVGIGFFGGYSTSNGEQHYFIGEGRDAIYYFDQFKDSKGRANLRRRSPE